MTDPAEATIVQARSVRYLFFRQPLHVGLVILLVSVCYALAAPRFGYSQPLLGLGDRGWFWLSVVVAVVHQVIVAFVFRTQLGWGVLSRLFGKRDLTVWGLVFMPLLIARPVVVTGLAIADSGSLMLPGWLALSLGAALLVPSVFAAWSVARYFGIPRALGGDHFRLHYRRMPMVREGAFSWTPNAMYLLVFLGLWSIALIARSHLALVAALFQHAYIWVHYYCTEKPDMDLMYG
jgi:hypothetical protein